MSVVVLTPGLAVWLACSSQVSLHSRRQLVELELREDLPLEASIRWLGSYTGPVYLDGKFMTMPACGSAHDPAPNVQRSAGLQIWF
ncbi:hypothetical protein WJX84_004355 [Apatococcus fuscideae]|uniref:Uncharacterized protein n=1 Tax=Apatococcus fuscideae TaxID=2026836 RepID=A0AAW1T4K0_9CHLO